MTDEAFEIIFNTRASILEFDAGMSRNEAEYAARIELLDHLKQSMPDKEASKIAHDVWQENRTLTIF